MPAAFRDRSEAGRVLAAYLKQYTGPNTIVLALPRGGVPVGFEVASALGAPLDVFVVRKLGVPGHEELAFGAIASGGVRVIHQSTVELLALTLRQIEDATRREEAELTRREREYRGPRAALDPRRKTVILVDDGLATGASMLAGVRALKNREPERIVVAVPVGSLEACRSLGGEADDAVCAMTPEPFQAVGLWYDDFRQTTDEEVRDLLARAAHRSEAA